MSCMRGARIAASPERLAVTAATPLAQDNQQKKGRTKKQEKDNTQRDRSGTCSLPADPIFGCPVAALPRKVRREAAVELEAAVGQE